MVMMVVVVVVVVLVMTGVGVPVSVMVLRGTNSRTGKHHQQQERGQNPLHGPNRTMLCCRASAPKGITTQSANASPRFPAPLSTRRTLKLR